MGRLFEDGGIVGFLEWKLMCASVDLNLRHRDFFDHQSDDQNTDYKQHMQSQWLDGTSDARQ